MLTLLKIALGPLLLLQGRNVRKTALRLPEAAGPRTGASRGAAAATPLRVLFVGDSSMAGVGVEHQDKALASQVASILAEHVETPVEWQIVARSGINTREALDLVVASELRPADLLVTSLGTNDATSQRSARQFVKDYQALVELVRLRAGAKAVIVNGVPPLHLSPAMPQPLRWYIGQCALRLDAGLRQWTRSNQALSFVSLQWAGVVAIPAADGFHPGMAQYAHWAGLVAQRAALLFRAGALCPRT